MYDGADLAMVSVIVLVVAGTLSGCVSCVVGREIVAQKACIQAGFTGGTYDVSKEVVNCFDTVTTALKPVTTPEAAK